MNYLIRGLGGAEYTICGVRIPKCTYTDKERARGRSEVVAVSENRYRDLCREELFRKLVRSGSVDVSPDKGQAPPPAQTGTDTVNTARLISENAALRSEVEALRALLAEKEAEKTAEPAVKVKKQRVKQEDLLEQQTEA